MKKNYKPNRFFNLFKKGSNQAIMLFALIGFSAGHAFSQQTYTFLTCNATGQFGPTQGQVTTAYNTTNLSGNVTVIGGGVQMWTVPITGAYKIRCVGASGGSVNVTCNAAGGLGADISGDFNLTAGSVLKILVGQKGLSDGSDAGGGGGSYVVSTTSVAMVVAGGGGGASNNVSSCGTNLIGVNASTTTAGTAGASGQGIGGTGGNGGSQSNGGSGGGGGGFSTSGNGGFFGLGFMQGGNGGTGANVNHGGFGGGGSGWHTGGNGGGGGGYSGGGTSGSSPYSGGGGGGSFNSGTNQVNIIASAQGNGMVVIQSLCNVQINGLTSICAGGSTTLSSTAVSGYSWSTGSTASSIVVSPSVSTSYTATGVGSLNNCNSTIIVAITVNALPVITGVVTPTMLCVGSTATIMPAGAATFTSINGPVTNGQFTVNPTATTNFSVVGTSTAGCPNMGVIPVVVNPFNVIATSTAICQGHQALLTATGASSYLWNNGVPFPSITVSPSVATNYTVSGVDVNGCTTSTTLSVTVNPLPPVTVSANKTTVCKGEAVTLTATGASSYAWNPTNTGAIIVVTPLVDLPTNYTVTGTDNGCSKDAIITLTVLRCTGINELQSGTFDILVYPNPNNGFFTIKSDVALTVNISNELGQVVKTLNLSENNMNEVNVTDLSSGIYFISGENNGVKLHKKISVNLK